MTEEVPILWRGQTKKTGQEAEHGEKRGKDDETEFALYRYGAAYLIGLPDRICVQQTTPGFKIKSKHPSWRNYWLLIQSHQVDNPPETYDHEKER